MSTRVLPCFSSASPRSPSPRSSLSTSDPSDALEAGKGEEDKPPRGPDRDVLSRQSPVSLTAFFSPFIFCLPSCRDRQERSMRRVGASTSPTKYWARGLSTWSLSTGGSLISSFGGITLRPRELSVG